MADLGKLKPDPKNARAHNPRNVNMIEESMQRNGFGRPILAANDLTIIAGNATAEAAGNVGLEDVQIVESDGTKVIVVKRTDVAPGSKTFHDLAVSDNRSAELASWDVDTLDDLQDEIDMDQYWRDDEWQSMHVMQDQLDADAEREAIKDKQPSRRILPLDAIFTYAALHEVACLTAKDAGFLIGCQSGTSALTPDHTKRWENAFSLSFLDNDFYAYDHAVHLDAVQRFRPKYATVRDLMTKEQCDAIGIAYFDFDTIMRYADELRAYCEHVIVIPKYDCLSDIPKDYMLGYSVPSSWGGTPLPAEKFRDYDVHLLGGSPKRQFGYLALLGDSVKSIDFNGVAKIAMHASFYTYDGSAMQLMDYDPELTVNNPRQLALTLSFGNLGRALYDIGANDSLAPQTVEPGSGFEDDDASIPSSRAPETSETFGMWDS